MHLRSRAMPALFGVALVVSACGPSGGGSSPSASDLRIGVVTDVGSVNDKNFNEFTFAGAKDGATAIGAPEPPVVVPTSDAEYGPLIQAYIDQDFDVVVSAGFNLEAPTTLAAKANPETWFVGVDHAPCINAAGEVDPAFADCSGAALLSKYVMLQYAEDQAGYLAGIVAAGASKSNVIGAIGGVSLCAPCIRYIQGYILGAKSVKPDITVKAAWVSDSDFTKGFFDQAGGKDFAQRFMQQNTGMDVLFQVAGLTGNGVLDAACEAGISGIGVDVDQYQSYPAAQACIITSAEKKLAKSVSDAIQAIAAGTATGGPNKFNAANDGIGIAPFHGAESKLAPDTQAKVDEAFAAMKAGTLTTCPEACGTQAGLPLGD